MAVAGGACSSIKLQVIDNHLHQWGKLYRLQSELTHEVGEALEQLQRGEVVMFKTLGGNLTALRARLAEMGVFVQEPIDASYRIQGGLH